MERTYNIPLRKAFLKAPKYLRTNRAVREVRSFLKRHTKSTNIKLGEELNKVLWARGDSKPPHHVMVLAKKEDDVVYAELTGKEFAKKDFSEKEEKEAPKKADAKKEAPAEA
jgi:large subunit ribosomal protein L31e